MATGKGSNGMTVLNSTSSNPEQTKENEQKQRGTATNIISEQSTLTRLFNLKGPAHVAKVSLTLKNKAIGGSSCAYIP